MLFALTAWLTGCSKNIGDSCTISTDCSASGDRLCDTTQPGGYCTQFNCEPNSCPDNSICVLFSENTCSAATQSVRFQRTFCMATCESDGDCRAGYRCLDVSSEPGRSVVDLSPSSVTVCIVPPALPTAATGEEPAICRGALQSDGGELVDGAPDAASESATADASDGSAVDADASDGAGPAVDADASDGAGPAVDAPAVDGTLDGTVDSSVPDVPVGDAPPVDAPADGGGAVDASLLE